MKTKKFEIIIKPNGFIWYYETYVIIDSEDSAESPFMLHRAFDYGWGFTEQQALKRATRKIDRGIDKEQRTRIVQIEETI